MNAVQDAQQVFLIDDDEAVRVAMSRLLESAGFVHRSFSSGDQFLEFHNADLSGCLLLDIRMPGVSGMDVQRRLNAVDSTLPIIFMTGHGDLSMAVRAMRLGALHFLRKPVDEKELLSSIRQAFERESALRKRMSSQREVSARLQALSDRERQIFELVTNGDTNKSISTSLQISERTVEVHRANAMKKLGVRTLAQLIWLRIEADQLTRAPDSP